MNPIIVALDNMAAAPACSLAAKLKGRVWGFKVNDLYFDEGPEIVQELCSYGNIMLDVKLYDIPNTVGNICRKIAKWGCMDNVKIITVHAHGGTGMMKAATKELPGKIAAVTVLTSFSQDEYRRIHGLGMEFTIGSQVNALATLASFSGCDYVVCSGQELGMVGMLKPIVPGIRPAWHAKADDQKRVMTPKEAIQGGAHLLVIGRPITEAEDPVKAVELTLGEINS